MPADIRSFFGPKGGGAPAPKPAPKKAAPEPAKGRRSRNVVEDSDDDEVIEWVLGLYYQ
jgi:replication factor C subunit 1